MLVYPVNRLFGREKSEEKERAERKSQRARTSEEIYFRGFPHCKPVHRLVLVVNAMIS